MLFIHERERVRDSTSRGRGKVRRRGRPDVGLHVGLDHRILASGPELKADA